VWMTIMRRRPHEVEIQLGVLGVHNLPSITSYNSICFVGIINKQSRIHDTSCSFVVREIKPHLLHTMAPHAKGWCQATKKNAREDHDTSSPFIIPSPKSYSLYVIAPHAKGSVK
jgi:hypothetical protein